MSQQPLRFDGVDDHLDPAIFTLPDGFTEADLEDLWLTDEQRKLLKQLIKERSCKQAPEAS